MAQAFIIGEKFIGNDSACLVLGDNIFYGSGFTKLLKKAVEDAEKNQKATVFGYWVSDPERYGVAEFDKEGNCLSIEEKPAKPKSNYAVVGIYFYPNKVVDVAKHIKPSARGELEITTVNQVFLNDGELKVQVFGRGFAWLDTGTHDSLAEASTFVEVIEKRQGLKVACLEGIAYRNGWITEEKMRELAKPMLKKSVKIKFLGSGLEVDIVPVVPIKTPEGYVWQPQRGVGGKYITSIDKQLAFAKERREENSSYTSIVRCLKWWRNYKELKPEDGTPGLSSFSIELIVAYLDLTRGIETNIEEGIIRFFEFVSTTTKPFPDISFRGAINNVPVNYDTPIFVADNTNNENNACKKLTSDSWKEIVEEASEAFDALCRAESYKAEGATIEEWKNVFGPTFDIK